MVMVYTILLTTGICFIIVGAFNIFRPQQIRKLKKKLCTYSFAKAFSFKSTCFYLINFMFLILGSLMIHCIPFETNLFLLPKSTYNSNKVNHLDPEIKSRIDVIIQEWTTGHNNYCVSVGVLLDDTSTVLNYGFPDKLNKSQTPPVEIIYQIGSITKVFTATLLAEAVNDGLVCTENPVAICLSQETNLDNNITVMDLTTHHSGLPRIPDNLFNLTDYLNLTFIKNPYSNYSEEDLYSFLQSYNVSPASYGSYEYSNLGYSLLGRILVEKTGKAYEQLIFDNFARKLDMIDTKIDLSEKEKQRLAKGYAGNLGRLPGIYYTASPWQMSVFEAAGGLFSTTNDLLKFLNANLNPDNHPAIAMTHHIEHDISKKLNIAWGWHVLNLEDGSHLYWHNGMTGGYAGFIGFNPKRKVGVVLLTNTASNVDSVALKIFEILYSQ